MVVGGQNVMAPAEKEQNPRMKRQLETLFLSCHYSTQSIADELQKRLPSPRFLCSSSWLMCQDLDTGARRDRGLYVPE
jgi:hypothetical protein